MPLLSVSASRKVTAVVSLEEVTAHHVDLYAAFTSAAPDDVINAALEYVFSKDKDFTRFCDENSAAKPPVKLRIKRGTSTGTSTAKTPKPTPVSIGAAR